jgi:hypothetical protein
MPDVKGSLSDDRWTYAEDRPGGGGGGPRSMKIMGPGIAQGGLLYAISPNPHGNAAYNDGGQQTLYAGFATKINAGWPKEKAATFTKVKDVSDLPKDLKAKALKMDAKKQKAAIDNYNTEGEAAAKKKALETYVAAVVAHIKGKAGKITYALGGVTYTMG